VPPDVCFGPKAIAVGLSAKCHAQVLKSIFPFAEIADICLRQAA
jgi:hypothetical protein